MNDSLDDMDHQHLRRQIRLFTLSGMAVGVGALVAILVAPPASSPQGLVASTVCSALIVIAFLGVAIVDRRLSGRWLPAAYGVAAWFSLQSVIIVASVFPALWSISHVMAGIMPVGIALYSRWKSAFQVSWCIACLVPLAATVFIPVGLDVWPLVHRIELTEAFAAGSLLSIVGTRVLDQARGLAQAQELRLLAARDAERRALEDLRRSERRYREIVELSTEGIWVADVDGRTTLANDRAAAILGFGPGEMQGRHVLEVLDPEVRERVSAYLGPETPTEPLGDVPARRADGQTVWLSVAATRLVDDTGTPFGTLAMFSDVSQRHELEAGLRESNEELDRLASVDGLTGIQNRRALDAAIGSREGSRRQVGVLLIDIDRFKRFNDANGHPAGDAALRAVAAALTSALRPDDAIYRYGGEEFLVLVERASDEAAVVIAGRARAAVKALRIPMQSREGDEVLTVSIGVASGRPRITPMRSLVAAADAALYQAKADGRDRVVLGEVAASGDGTSRSTGTADGSARPFSARPGDRLGPVHG